MKNKIILCIALISLLLASFGVAKFIYHYGSITKKINIYVGDTCCIPHDCKHMALLGCTPHPTDYLKNKNDPLQSLHTITLDAFLDIDYVRDSFDQTFSLCKAYNIDHLLIAYLPIYYMGMKKLLGNQFIEGCRIFFNRIIKDIATLLQETSARACFDGKITLILPPDYQLACVPDTLEENDDRIRYLIKQFPTLTNISTSLLATITIINNKKSYGDDMLMHYLKYEYLYEKPVTYKKCTIGKERFHKGKD